MHDKRTKTKQKRAKTNVLKRSFMFVFSIVLDCRMVNVALR